MIIGYGKKQNKDVWIVQNSLGEAWGSKGVFFVEREQNTLCIENNMWGYVSAHYDTTENRKANRGIMSRGGSSYLDPDEGTACEGAYYYDEGTQQSQCDTACAKASG